MQLRGHRDEPSVCRPIVSYPDSHGHSPTRIDLLELDIDLRLADLWREAAGITEWSLDVVAAFMRAAYGKGYCDALTEDRRVALRRARLPRACAEAAACFGRRLARLPAWPAPRAARPV
jgi:hypothetical protein